MSQTFTSSRRGFGSNFHDGANGANMLDKYLPAWGDLRERPDSHEEAAGFESTSSSVVMVVVKLVQTPFHSLVLTECSRFETLDNLVLWPFRTSFQPCNCNSSWWSIFPSKHEATMGWLLFYIFPHLQSSRSRGLLHEVGQAAKFLPALVGAAGIEPWEIISEGYVYCIYIYIYIYIYVYIGGTLCLLFQARPPSNFLKRLKPVLARMRRCD